jgi:hypothetical protein
MENYVLSLALVSVGLLTAACSSPASSREGSLPPVDSLEHGEQVHSPPALIVGQVLPALDAALSTTQGGHVRVIYFSQGQTVKAGDVLLKLGIGPRLSPRISFVLAPSRGEISACRLRVGDYLAAGTPYAVLTQSVPLRVRVARTTSSTQPGDSLRVMVGPPALVGAQSVLSEIRPLGTSPDSVVLLLPDLRWPRHSSADLVLAPPERATPRADLVGKPLH